MFRSAFILLLVTACPSGCSRRSAEEPKPGSAAVRIMTYNINYGLEGDENTLEAIRSGGADIVLLQETTDGWEEALRKEFKQDYPHMKFRHCCGAGGLAILSRYELEEKDYIPSPSGWFPAWRMIVDSPLGRLQLLNVHLHPPISEKGGIVSGYLMTPKVRLQEIESFYGYLDTQMPTIVAGDFNESGKGRAVSLLEEKGFATALPEFQAGKATWRWHTRVGKISMQLDHIMYSEHLTPLSARVIEEGRSDHLPVMAVFERSQAAAIPASSHSYSSSGM